MSLLNDIRLNIGDLAETSGVATSSNCINDLRLDVGDDGSGEVVINEEIQWAGTVQSSGSCSSEINLLRLDVGDDSVTVYSSTEEEWAGLNNTEIINLLRVDIGDDFGVPSDVKIVIGPNLSTDNAIVRWDGEEGKYIQNSSAILDDDGNLTTSGDLLGTHVFAYRTITTAGDVDVLSSDNVVFINKTVGEPTLVRLPSISQGGRMVIIKDKKGDAFINNITIRPIGLIDGLSEIVLGQNGQSYTLISTGNNNWSIV